MAVFHTNRNTAIYFIITTGTVLMRSRNVRGSGYRDFQPVSTQN